MTLHTSTSTQGETRPARATTSPVLSVEKRALKHYLNQVLRTREKVDYAEKQSIRAQRDFDIAHHPLLRRKPASWLAIHLGTTENAIRAVRKRLGIKGWQK